jgi:hypothetical protein
VLAQHGVDQVPVPVERPIKVTPPAPDLQIRLVDMPASAGPTPHPLPALAQRVAHDRQQLRLPGADGLVAHLDPTQQHVIVIYGDNRSFDHLLATYKPVSGDNIMNLLSEGIVNSDGTPGRPPSDAA